MRKTVVLVILLLLVPAIPMLADSIVLSGIGSGSTSVGGSGNFYFYNNNGGYGPYNNNVLVNDTDTAQAAMGTLALPSGAILTSALLTWSTTANTGTHQSAAGRSEIDYQYQSGSYQVCTSYFLGICVGWTTYPIYSYGYGGSGTVNTMNMIGGAVINVGGNTLALSPAGSGSVDLLAAGFGSALLGGGAVSFSSGQTTSMYMSISSYGYYAGTFYYPQADNNPFSNTATLTIDYQVESGAVPEPASMLLLGTGLAALAGLMRRMRT